MLFAVNCVVLVVNCVVLLLIVLFYVLFLRKCVLYYCHRVSIQLQLTNISYHISYHTIPYHIPHHIISYRISYHISYHIIVINDFRNVCFSPSSSHCKRQRINGETETYFLCIFISFNDKKEWVHQYA